jgi:predicted nuclease with RNAse H fold
MQNEQKQNINFIGIDFGSQNAGTTVICFSENKQLKFISSEKNKSADDFLISQIDKISPEFVFIDAPLSLPAIYRESDKYSDYFFRECDKTLKAMSPMFIGGLTARAIKIKDFLEKKNIKVFEIYPSHLAKILNLKDHDYKGQKSSIGIVLDLIFKEYPHLKFEAELKTWHEVDSFLAYISGYRYINNQAQIYGNIQEGIIIV